MRPSPSRRRRKRPTRPTRLHSCRRRRSTRAAGCSSHRTANPGFWNPDKNNFEPRVGFAYQLNSKTVLRGGLGVYAVPFIISGVVQHGFSQNTALIASDNLGLTFRANLANPYPAGVLNPAGASLGVNTFLGQGIGRFAPSNLRNGENARYLINIQRELPGQWLFEAGYTGSRGWDITTDLDLNPLPAQYLSTSPVRDQANDRLPRAARGQPVRRAGARGSAQQRDRGAIAVAAAVPAVHRGDHQCDATARPPTTRSRRSSSTGSRRATSCSSATRCRGSASACRG